MDIFISNSSNVPIYDQICKSIKDLIVSGKLESGEALPSIRNLAKDLRISVITTKRAYEELEREGYIDTIPGKGCFVATRGIELLKEANLIKIEEHMQSIAKLAVSCNLANEDLVEMFRTLLKEDI
ncbi:GntR family transcriptional regulator [Anaerocolumna xylanovorans]|uniref:GntR family transcriptional regulator n=1 Tax=Anaerocolumna xylanovorans DSM 12503 TaxID=1121345 RepID=A0A1M7XX14_9FIRM|nr:GntR family transcriptional regulator [Anaerocolumna xylanovorans]SHO43378.1 GntR family transcriptional regulator [Anaerocolumna xylanovorans DSM 12503]